MNLPFTQDQFFGVFAAYKVAVWPAQFVLTVLAISMLVIVLWMQEGRPPRLLWAGVALVLACAGLSPGLLLAHQPGGTLKIDGSFIKDMLRNSGDYAMVSR